MEIRIDEQERVLVRHSFSASYLVLNPDGTVEEWRSDRGSQLVYDSDGPQPDRSSDDYNAGFDDGFDTAEQKSNGRLSPSRKPAVVVETVSGGQL